jgi:hypothetical protein
MRSGLRLHRYRRNPGPSAGRPAARRAPHVPFGRSPRPPALVHAQDTGPDPPHRHSLPLPDPWRAENTAIAETDPTYNELVLLPTRSSP